MGKAETAEKKAPEMADGHRQHEPWYAIGSARSPSRGHYRRGVSVIVEAKLSSWQSYLALALFCVIATSSILAMEILRRFRPKRRRSSWHRLRHWIDTIPPGHLIVSLVLGLLAGREQHYYLITSCGLPPVPRTARPLL